MEEILGILPKAWTGQPFTHQGEVYDLPTLAVRPAPAQRIPIVIGGGAERAIRRAARLADGIFANVPDDEFLQQVAWVRDECETIGRDPASFRFIHYSVMLPGTSRQEALERYVDHLWAMSWKYDDMEDSATRPGPPPAPPSLSREDHDLLRGRSTIAGTTDEIVERLRDIRRQAGVPVEFVARSYFPTLPCDDQVAVMQELAEGVAPHV
jgi:alkanesulfonate monooxygenase SsuD/methylene tetrahydromethanopterin reductase-like flavin-dependent oxidoreductase (luciferase family)